MRESGTVPRPTAVESPRHARGVEVEADTDTTSEERTQVRAPRT
jgi:hypothetical protein